MASVLASPILIRGTISGGDCFARYIGVIWLATSADITESASRSGIEPIVRIVGSVSSVDHTVELQDLPFEHSQPPNLLCPRRENQFPACAKNCEHPGNPVIQRKQELPRRTSRLPSNCGNRATLTFLKASQTSRLGMSNGLALSTEFLPLPVASCGCQKRPW